MSNDCSDMGCCMYINKEKSNYKKEILGGI